MSFMMGRPGVDRGQQTGESGSILILTALSMVVLLGIAALAVDASFMYDKRNRLHAAADAGAKSAAFELQRNSSISLTDLRTFANQQVSAHGFNPAGTTSVVVNHPPASGAFTGNAGYVEVIVSEPTSTFFGKILGWASMTPGARAVAGTSNNLACITTLAPSRTSPFYSLEIGNSTFTLNGCGVAVGGNLGGSNPNSTINGAPLPSVGVVGTCSGTCGNCSLPTSSRCMGKLTTGAPQPSDPLSGLTAPTNPGGCIAGVAATLSPGCYTSIASSVRTLTPGIYYVTGKVTASNLTGTDVMIYLTGAGQMSAGNNDDLHLSAPTSGPYTGIAIFQDPSDTNDFSTGNSFTMDVSGAVYMPGADVNFANHLSFGGSTCSVFIAHSLNTNNGSGQLTNAGCATTYAGAAFLSVSIAE
jgi:Flp pilus assembly protein TadG